MSYFCFTEDQLQAAVRQWAHVQTAGGKAVHPDEAEQLARIVLQCLHSQQALEGGLIQGLTLEDRPPALAIADQ